MLADWIHIDQMHADADVCPGSTYTGRRIYMQEGEARSEVMLDNIDRALREKGYLVRA